MGVQQPIFGRAMFLDTEVSAGQLVKITGDESVSVATAATDVAVGVALFAGEVGDKVTCELFCKGVVSGVTTGAVTAGVNVSASTEGKIKASAASDYAIGVALKGGSTGATISYLVK